jgi:hypothetical protein
MIRMRNFIVFLMSLIFFIASIVYGADCRITEETTGFRDTEAMKALIKTDRYKYNTGNSGPYEKMVYKLLLEKRSVFLDKGEKAELLKVDQLDEETIMQIRIADKGVMWIMGIDLKCR